MRVVAGRGYWLPHARIGGIARLAFIGDSYVFGQGVGLDETLPARTEHHLNQVSDTVPVEAANLGVCGYNFWNSWLSFRRLAQVYDGVILTLCCNDAQLFGRTYDAIYSSDPTALWLAEHPVNAALESGFDAIAEFVSETQANLAVCYFNVMGDRPYAEQRWSGRIAEAIGKRCAARNIAFIDMHAHFVERNFPAETSVVSEADYHPSAMAHDAAARHVAARVKEMGWLARSELSQAAPTVADGMNALVTGDSYPPDAALRWGEATLSAKLQAARRLEALSGDSGTSDALEAERNETKRTAALWQRGMRISALLQRALSGSEGIAPHLSAQIDEQMLRLDEVAFVSERAGQLISLVPSPMPVADVDLNEALSRAQAQLAALAREIASEWEALDLFQTGLARSWLAATEDAVRFETDRAGLARLLDRLDEKIAEFQRTLERVGPRLLSRDWTEAGALRAQLAAEIEAGARGAVAAREKLRVIGWADQPPWTTVSVEVSAPRVEGRHPCALEVMVSSTAPYRLPLLLRQNFLPDGERWMLRFAFPAFCAGRIVVVPRMPDPLANLEPEVGEVEIACGPARCKIERGMLTRDETGRLVSPPVFVL
jgi:lysophospholipase L1-like esterase